MLTVKLRKPGQAFSEQAVSAHRTTDPYTAIERAGKRLGYTRGIGNIQHFRGGSTYHVQFATGHHRGATSLSDMYVAYID